MAKRSATKYGGQYRQIAEELFGQGELTAFRLPDDVVKAAESRLHLQLPSALREYYKELGGFRKLNEAHNRVVSPAKLETHEGVLIFYEENQWVCSWGIRVEDLDGTNSDPVVYQGTRNRTWNWYSEEMKISEFLRLVIYQQAAWGALEYHFRHSDAKEAIRILESSWEKVVDNRDLRIWKKDGILANHLGDEQICDFAGRDASALESLRKALGIPDQGGALPGRVG